MRALIAFCSLSLVSCAITPASDSSAELVAAESLCDVARNPDRYSGKPLLLSARYVSDLRHEEVLEDAGCEGGRMTLDIGKRSATESVSVFYESIRLSCIERGSPYLCNVAASVRVIGSVGVMSGQYVLHLEEVLSREFETEFESETEDPHHL